MSNPSVPVVRVITGPAIVQLGPDVFYSKAGIVLKYNRATFQPDSDFHGKLDVRAKGQAVVEIALRPVGMTTSLAPRYRAVGATVAVGGSSGTYALADVLTPSGLTGTAPTFAASAIGTGGDAGKVTAVTLLTPGYLTAAAGQNPLAVTGGGGSGCTLNVTWAKCYAAFPLAPDMVGKSIFGPAASPTTCTIWTADGRVLTFSRAGVLKMPSINLRPSDTLFSGDMTIRAIGKATTQMSDTSYLFARTTAAFADASFDETKILTDIYSAAWGSTSPYNAMGAMSGFELSLEAETKDIESDDFGLADTTLTSLQATAKFSPSNLTESDVETLLAYQGASAILPGQSVTKANQDLVIAGVSGALVATLYKAGPHQNSEKIANGVHALDAIEWVTRRTWTTGVANPLWDFTVS